MMTARGLLLVLAVLPFLPAIAVAEQVRDVPVVVAVDEEMRARDGWEQRIGDRLARVSAMYEDRFGIRWTVAETIAWTSDNRRMDMTSRLHELQRDIALGEAEVLVGVSGQPGLVKGAAETLGNVLLVVDAGEYDEDRNTVILAHELAHLFGAWHSSDPASLMYGVGATALAVDDATAAVIHLMRDFDFRRGLDGLDQPTLERLTVIYEAEAPPGEVHPIARAYMGIGHYSYLTRDYEAAVEADREAVRLSPRWSEARRMLSKALFRAGHAQEAWEEYWAAQKLGAPPNWAYVREMRRALIRITGTDPLQ